MPSAPLPVSMVASKPTVNEVDDSALGQKPEPAWLLVAGVSWSWPPRIEADPFSCQPPAVGSGTIDGPPLPDPVRFTTIAPWPSSPVMLYVADAGPGVDGENVTVWVRCAPGARISPSGSGFAVLNVPAGAFALEMTSGPAPVSATSKVSVFAVPVAIVPKSTVVGVIVRWPGGTPLPVSATVIVSPRLSFSTRLPLHAPPEVGANDRPIASDDLPAMLVPAAGRPDALNGAAGAGTDEIVNAV